MRGLKVNVKRAIVLVVAIVIGMVFIGGALSAGRACAHDPRFACSPRDKANPIVVTDAQKSWAFYGDLRSGEYDRYVAKTTHSLAVPMQVLVDKRDTANPARPVATVADASGKTLAVVNFSRVQSFFEPFSRVTYLASVVRTVALPPGQSTIVVTMHGGAARQRYTLALGRDERFSVLEMPYLFGAVYRVHARNF